MKILKERSFRKKIEVEFPAEDGPERQSFVAVFRVLKPDALEGRYLRTDEEQRAFLADVLVGWDGLTEDRDGHDAPFLFSAENRNELLSDVFVRRAVLKTYLDAMTGVAAGN